MGDTIIRNVEIVFLKIYLDKNHRSWKIILIKIKRQIGLAKKKSIIKISYSIEIKISINSGCSRRAKIKYRIGEKI